MLSVDRLKGRGLDQLTGPGEVLVIEKLAQSADQELTALVDKSYPSLKRQNHYLTIHVGFFEPSGQRPYVICDWQKPLPMLMEARWLQSEMWRDLKKSLQVKKLAIVCDGEWNAGHLVLVEDLYSLYMQPRYGESCLEGFKVWTRYTSEHDVATGHWQTRFNRQLDFRRWVNANPDEMTSVAIAEKLSAFCAQDSRTQIDILDEKALHAEGLNLLLAVGQAASVSPPRLIVVKYSPEGAAGKPMALVGKGITFDTGGINLKTHENLVTAMKNDMAGAALVAQLFMHLVETDFPQPLVVAIPTCENLIDAGSYKPGAVIRSHRGIDVFIEHTDAEGRLLLADALSYVQKFHEPRRIMTVATLTTAALRQFSSFYTPVHFASAAVQKSLEQRGAEVGENFCFWPEFLPFAAANKATGADISNRGMMPGAASGAAGSNVAAHFLRRFVEVPYLHCDIFPTTWNWGDDYPGAHYGATGAPYNALYESLSQDSAAWYEV